MNSHYDVVIIVDDNSYTIPEYDGVIKVVKIDNRECEDSGYKSSVLQFDNMACSRDKALYYFNKNNISYKFIWFVEEDVFIPNIGTLENIDKKNRTGDLLVSSHAIIMERRTDWHWKHVSRQIKLEPPYGSSMICAIRCSNRMMQSIDAYVKQHNNLFLDEALFNTLAIHSRLDVKCIPELKSIVYKRDWKIHDITLNNMYHPVKSIEAQYNFRQYLRARAYITNKTRKRREAPVFDFCLPSK